MHVHALCVSCKEITTRNNCNRSRVGEAGIRREALYTTRGLCECTANSLTRAVLNTAMGGARLLHHGIPRVHPFIWYDRLAK